MKNEIGTGVDTPLIVLHCIKFTIMSKERVFEGFFSLREGNVGV